MENTPAKRSSRPRRPSEKHPRTRDKRPQDRRDAKDAAPRRPQAGLAGLAAREEAVRLVAAVLIQHRALDEALVNAPGRSATLAPRDRAFARAIAATVLRRLGRLEALLQGFLEKPLPADRGRLWPILLAGTAQLLFLETPPHAAINLAVEQCRRDRNARRFDRLANALLRRVTREGHDALAAMDPIAHDIPAWLLAGWEAAYGPERAQRIVAAQLTEAALDLTPKRIGEAAIWAERVGGIVLPTGTIRLPAGGLIGDLPGYSDGAWWVQDAAAALPARLLGDVAGRAVADLCAAPGGKTAQLAAAGANVTAVDLSTERLARLEANLSRLGLSAETVAADIRDWQPGRTFDAILLDAPCTATGTIRRHPDILRLKRQGDIAAIGETQAALLDAAAGLLAPGGRLVYCTCSLEPLEGPEQIVRFLAAHPEFVRKPINADEVGGEPGWNTPDGDMRTLPCDLDTQTPPGLDGFFVARLEKRL